jgi:hypothetical protein
MKLYFFNEGSSAFIKGLVAAATEPAVFYPLYNATSDHYFINQVVEEVSPKARMVDLASHLGTKERYQHLDDYVRIINEWSLLKNSRSGKNLRESLAFAGEISAWWLFAFTEKATTSAPVELFKAISIVRNLSERPTEIVFLGKPNDAGAISHLAKEMKISFSISTDPVFGSDIGGSQPMKRNRIISYVKGFFFRRNLRTSRGAKRASVAFLSDYPQAWAETNGVSKDRYLDHIIQFFRKRNPNETLLALQMGYGFPVDSRAQSAMANGALFSEELNQKLNPVSVELIDSYSRFGSFVRAKVWGIAKARTMAAEFSRGSFGKIEYRGVNLTDYFSEEIISGLSGRIPHLLSQGLDTARFLKRTKAKICFYRNEFYCYGRTHSWACHRAKVAGFGLQHGIINSKYGVYQFHPSEIQPDFLRQDMIHAMPSPARFGLWGEWYRDQITSFAPYPKEALPIIGCERILKLAEKLDSSGNAKLRTDFGLRSDSRILLFTVQDVQTLEAVDIVLKGLSNFQSVEPLEVIFKLHHFHENSMRECITRLLPKSKTVTFHFLKGELASMIAVCDAVVTAYSATGIEALLLNRPVITIQIPSIAGDSSFKEFSRFALEASSPLEFVEAVSILFGREKSRDPKRLAEIGQRVFAVDQFENESVLLDEIKKISEKTSKFK